MNLLTVPELKARADALKLTYPAKIRKADLIDLITDAEAANAGEYPYNAEGAPLPMTPARVAKHEQMIAAYSGPTVAEAHATVEGFATAYPRAARHARKVARDVNALTSMRYGMRGRGMGAKHYPNRVSEPLSRAGSGKGGGRGTVESMRPLSYADRVRHYAKQNGQSTLTADTFDGAMLTPAQWRRAQHKQNKNRAFGTKASRYAA